MADSVKIKITGDASEFQNTLSGIRGTAGSMFKGIMASQIVTKGISLLTGELKNAITTGMQFEAAMSQVAAISGATGSELELLTETAKHYGETTMFSASQAAEALNYMALAGWDANQSVDALGGVLDLAAASGMDLGAASDAVTDYLSAFSMEASQAGYMADMMAYAQSRSNTTASMLADAYGNCASSMHAAGQDIETTTAMLMALANQGIKGSEAGTQMAAVMRDLTQKMDDGQIMIGKTAVQVADAQGNFRDLNDIITDVGKATEGMGTAEQSAAIMTTFTARSVKAIQTLLNEGMDNVNAYEDALRGSEGTAAEQARIMMDNLQGDIKLYQSALEGVRITASESLNDSARGIVQEGTAVLDAMNQAGKTQGIGGMFDAAIAQIPRLLPKAVKGVEGLLSGVGKRLPGLVTNLISTIPDILGGMGELVPGLIDSLTQAAGAGIEGLISNLPTLTPVLISGIGDVLIGAGKGIENLAGGVLRGVAGALKSQGLMDLDLDDRIAEAFEGIDTSGIDVGDVQLASISIDGDIDTQPYLDSIATAKSDLTSAIDSLKLSDTDAEALKKALMKGSGADALKAALKALNVPEADIQTVVSNISGFKSKMDAVFAEFNVSDDDGSVSQNIADYVSKGGSLEEALTLFAGLSAADAKTAAEKLQPDLDAAVKAINALNIEGLDIATIKQACIDANGDIAAALKMLGADDATIATALAGVDTLKDNITTHLETAFDEIKKAFTNGKAADDAEAANKALSEIGEASEQGHEKINTWLSEYKQQLSDMNLSATEYETAVKNAEEKAQAMRDELDATISAAQDWVSSNAGAAKSEVEAHIGELDTLLSNIEALESRLETLRSRLNLRDYAVRDAVERGVLGDQNSQATAMKLTAAEYEKNVTEAAETCAKALDEADKKIEQASKDKAAGKLTDQEYNDAIKAAGEEKTAALQAREEAEAQAAQQYNDHMTAITDSLVKSTPGLTEQLDKAATDVKNATNAGGIVKAINEAFANGETLSVDDMLSNLNIQPADMDSLAKALNFEGTGEQLRAKFADILSKGETADQDWANTAMQVLGLDKLAQGADQAMADALEGIDMEGAAKVLTKAMEEGWLFSTEGLDASDPQAMLKQALMSYIQNAVEDVGKESKPQTAEPKVEVEPEVTTAPETAEKVGKAVEEVTKKADKVEPAKPEIPVEPEIQNPEAARQALTDAIRNATTGMTLDDVLANANVSQADFEGLANAMGIDPVALGDAINGALKSFDPSEALTGVFNGVNLSSLTQPIGAGISEGVTTGIESGAGAAASASESMGRQAAEAAGTGAAVNSPSAITVPVGEGIAEGVSTGIISGTGAAVAAGTALGNSAANAVKSGTGSVQSAGRNLSAGLASGILAGRGAVVAAARSVAQAAANAMRSAMQIHSPSKVTEGFGRMFDQGLVVGIDKGTKDVVSSAVAMSRRVAGAANLAPRMDFSGLSASMDSAMNDFAEAESSRQYVFRVNGRDLAAATSRDYGTELNGFAKRISMGYGRG